MKSGVIMYLIKIMNEKGVIFEETCYSEYLLRKRLIKIKYSKKLTLISWGREY